MASGNISSSERELVAQRSLDLGSYTSSPLWAEHPIFNAFSSRTMAVKPHREISGSHMGGFFHRSHGSTCFLDEFMPLPENIQFPDFTKYKLSGMKRGLKETKLYPKLVSR